MDRMGRLFVLSNARHRSARRRPLRAPRFQRLSACVVFISALAFGGAGLRAEEGEIDAAAMAKLLPAAPVSLERALKASAAKGKPISGKYEVENGALQLSVYTTKAGAYFEVVVDDKTAAIQKSEKIADAEDLADAKKQNAAMRNARLSLANAVAAAIKANTGYRAVSATPMFAGDRAPVAAVILMKGATVKKVLQKLD
jgi:hypothetical protein